jgi:hypothetical protein
MLGRSHILARAVARQARRDARYRSKSGGGGSKTSPAAGWPPMRASDRRHSAPPGETTCRSDRCHLPKGGCLRVTRCRTRDSEPPSR